MFVQVAERHNLLVALCAHGILDKPTLGIVDLSHLWTNIWGFFARTIILLIVRYARDVNLQGVRRVNWKVFALFFVFVPFAANSLNNFLFTSTALIYTTHSHFASLL